MWPLKVEGWEEWICRGSREYSIGEGELKVVGVKGGRKVFAECFKFRSGDFDRVFAKLRPEGKRIAVVGNLSLYRLPRNVLGAEKKGNFMIAISRKLKGAVNKNRAKRRLKHAAYEAGACSNDSDSFLLAIVRGEINEIPFKSIVSLIKNALR